MITELPPQYETIKDPELGTITVPCKNWPVDLAKCNYCPTLIGWTSEGWAPTFIHKDDLEVCEDCHGYISDSVATIGPLSLTPQKDQTIMVKNNQTKLFLTPEEARTIGQALINFADHWGSAP